MWVKSNFEGDVTVTDGSADVFAVAEPAIGGSARLFGFGLNATIDAGQNLTAVSFGSFDLTGSAGGRASAMSTGLLGMDFSAGGSVQLSSYTGVQVVSVHSDSHIARVWSLGDIAGDFSADGNIDTIISWSSIWGNITAGGNCGDESDACGNIRHV